MNHEAERPGAHPGLQSALPDAQVPVGHHKIGVDLHTVAEACAGRTGTVGVIEAEGARLQLAKAYVAVHAGEVLREEQLLAVDDRHEDGAAGHPEGGLYRVGDATRLGAITDDQAVDHDLDGVPLLLIEGGNAGKVVDIAIDAHPDESRAAGLLEDLLVLALPASHHRRHDLYAAAFGQVEHGVDYLLYRLALDRPAAPVTVGASRPGEEQAQVVEYLGDGPDGRGGGLCDTPFWSMEIAGERPSNVVYVGLVHAAKELPGVG